MLSSPTLLPVQDLIHQTLGVLEAWVPVEPGGSINQHLHHYCVL